MSDLRAARLHEVRSPVRSRLRVNDLLGDFERGEVLDDQLGRLEG